MRSFDLPVAAVFPGLRDALGSFRAVVPSGVSATATFEVRRHGRRRVPAAPPGTGKISFVPLVLG